MTETEKPVLWSEKPVDSKLFNVMNLNQLLSDVDNGELDKLYANGLEYVSFSNWQTIIHSVMQKVKVGGSVQFKITNLGFVLKNIVRRIHEPQEYNDLLWDGKMAVITNDRFQKMLSQFGKITDMKIETVDFLITVERQ